MTFFGGEKDGGDGDILGLRRGWRCDHVDVVGVGIIASRNTLSAVASPILYNDVRSE